MSKIRFSLLLASVILLVAIRAIPVFTFSYTALQPDTYYHSVIPRMIINTQHLPSESSLPYTSVPLFFIFHAMYAIVMGIDTIFCSNILYVIFLMVIALVYYVMVQHFMKNILLISNSSTHRIASLSALVYTVLFLYYPVAAPSFYATLLYVILVTQLFSCISTAPRRFVFVVVTILVISISLAHHLTQLVLLFLTGGFLLNTLANTGATSRRRNNIIISIIITSIVMTSIAYNVVYSFKGYITSLMDYLITDQFRESIMYASTFPSKLPNLISFFLHLYRALLIFYLFLAFLYILKEGLIQNLIRSLFLRRGYIDPRTTIVAMAISSSIPTLIVAFIALERIFIYTGILLIPYSMALMFLNHNYEKNGRGSLYTMAIIVLILITIVTPLVKVEMNFTAGPPHVTSEEDFCAHFLVRYLDDTALITTNVATDFWMAGVLRYYTATSLNHILFSITDYDPKFYNVLFNNSANNELYIITERTLKRAYTLFGIEVKISEVLTSSNSIYMGQKAVILYR